MDNELVLKVDNIKKRYRLGVIGGGTLQGDIQSWWARIRGKEDPNLKIGSDTNTKGVPSWHSMGLVSRLKRENASEL